MPLYDPCADGSRLGVTREQLNHYLAQSEFLSAFELISGLHFHTLCEQDFPPLERTLSAVESSFSDVLDEMEWVNFGGGHHITRADYQRDELINCIQKFSSRYQVQVYLEPGEAVAIGTGVLVSEVMDIRQHPNSLKMPQAILDTSATCHMPDTLEMPYRAAILGEVEQGEKSCSYSLGGQTCLAGDVIGDYHFRKPLQVGDRLIFEDMAHYTMVKTTTFNGIGLPAIAIWNSVTDELRVVREFDYDDFKTRLS